MSRKITTLTHKLAGTEVKLMLIRLNEKKKQKNNAYRRIRVITMLLFCLVNGENVWLGATPSVIIIRNKKTTRAISVF